MTYIEFILLIVVGYVVSFTIVDGINKARKDRDNER